MGAKIVYGVKYYIKDIETEFDIFETQQQAESFWNNKSYNNIIPIKLVKGSVNTSAIFKNENQELKYYDDKLNFKSIEVIKTLPTTI